MSKEKIDFICKIQVIKHYICYLKIVYPAFVLKVPDSVTKCLKEILYIYIYICIYGAKGTELKDLQ